MITFLKNKFNLTEQQISRVNKISIELSEESLNEIWLDNAQLSFENFCNELELQEELSNRANNYDLSTMTSYDSSMSDEKIYASFMNISIEEVKVIIAQHSPEAKV